MWTKHLGPAGHQKDSWRLCPLSNEVPTGEGVCLHLCLWGPTALPSVCFLHESGSLFSKGSRTLHSPPPAQVCWLPAAVILHRVLWKLLADRIQHGQQLGLRGCGQSQAQEPAQCAHGHHRQLGQVGGQSQLLGELRQGAQTHSAVTLTDSTFEWITGSGRFVPGK